MFSLLGFAFGWLSFSVGSYAHPGLSWLAYANIFLLRQKHYGLLGHAYTNRFRALLRKKRHGLHWLRLWLPKLQRRQLRSPWAFVPGYRQRFGGFASLRQKTLRPAGLAFQFRYANSFIGFAFGCQSFSVGTALAQTIIPGYCKQD